ncbi:fibritin neck whisker [Serratia phage 92A1]|nr:fibritin neck whisker [Serratia phage 92A1]
MTSELTLQSIPFVDGLPDEGQKRLAWILNGDCLDGAENKTSNTGSLNRVPVQIQKNVKTLDENANKTKDKVNVLVNKVNIIEENLGVIADKKLVDMVNAHDTDITILKVQQEVTNADLLYLGNATDDLKADLGNWHAELDPVYRPVRKELLWIKKELGNYPGFDFNGQVQVDNAGHGLKGIVMDSVSEIVNHRVRIDKLEKDWVNSDVGQVVTEVQSLREETGPKSEAIRGKPVYTRLKSLESISSVNATDIDEIKTAIDFDGGDIIGRVDDLENRVMIMSITLEDPLNGLRPRIEKLEATVGDDTTPGSIKHSIKLLKESNDHINSVIGSGTGDGLQYAVAHLNSIVGVVDDGEPLPSTSILFKLDAVQSQSMSNTQAISDIHSTLGVQVSEHEADLETITNILSGDDAATTPIQKAGLISTVDRHDKELKAAVNNPDDQFYYVRQGDRWVQIPVAAGRYGLVGGTKIQMDEVDKDYLISMGTLTADAFNRALTINENSLGIIDRGGFKIEAKMRMNKKHDGKKFVVSIYVNGIKQQAEWIAFDSLDGVISTSMVMLNIVETDLIDLYVNTEEELGEITIDQLSLTVQPL